MTISNITNQGTYASGLLQKQQSMNNMFAALKSGDIATAQKLYTSTGLPQVISNNTSPLGRLYQALIKADLPGAQQAALDMQHKGGAKSGVKSTTSPSTTYGENNTSAQKAASILANANIEAQKSSVFAMLNANSNLTTAGSTSQQSGFLTMLGANIDTNA
jgi:hypothetical protein